MLNELSTREIERSDASRHISWLHGSPIGHEAHDTARARGLCDSVK